MAKTGIKIKRANVGSIEAHNERTKEYLEGLAKAGKEIYFFPDLTHNNSSWVNPRYEGKTCQTLFEEMKSLYREKVGQEPQLQDRVRTNKKTGKEYTVAGWSPIREGCPPIKEDTKIEDFSKVIDWARSNGLDVIRIDLHQDEGHVDWAEEEKNKKKDKPKTTLMRGTEKETEVCEDSIKLNRHAHIVFDWVNHETGKTIKLDDAKMSELQDILASALSMERGEKKEITGKQHKSHAEYREMKAAESAAAMEKEAEEAKEERDAAQRQIENLREENKALELRKESIEHEIKSLDSSLSLKAEGVIKGTAQGIADFLTRKSKKRADKAEEEARKYKAYAIAKGKETKEAVEKAQRAEQKADERISEVTAWKREHQAELDQIERYKRQLADKNKELSSVKDNVKCLIEDSASIGLSVTQVLSLYQGQELTLPHITLPEHKNVPITTKDESPWRLRFREKLEIVHKNVWTPISTWIKDARRSVKNWLREQELANRSKGRSL